MRESSFRETTVTQAMNIYAILIFVVLWVGFAFALVVNQEWLDLLWSWVRSLPLVVEIIVWVLFLPIMVGLWIWESSWPALVRLLGFAGLLGLPGEIALYRGAPHPAHMTAVDPNIVLAELQRQVLGGIAQRRLG